MNLIITVAFLALISSLFRFSFDENLTFLTFHFHKTCLQLEPKNLIFSSEWKALVCGEPMITTDSKILYQNLGLIHLFVVSGAHLVRLEKLIQWTVERSLTSLKVHRILYLKYLFIWICLGLFTLACLANPPVFRSFLSLTLILLVQIFNLKYSDSYKTFITGLLCLALNPSWIHSLSFQMSWLMALVISQKYSDTKFCQYLMTNILCWFFLWISVSALLTPHPLTIFINLVAATLLEFILFPLALLSTFLPYANNIFDIVLTALTTSLKIIPIPTSKGLFHTDTTLTYLNWFLICGLQTTIELKKIQHSYVIKK